MLETRIHSRILMPTPCTVGYASSHFLQQSRENLKNLKVSLKVRSSSLHEVESSGWVGASWPDERTGTAVEPTGSRWVEGVTRGRTASLDAGGGVWSGTAGATSFRGAQPQCTPVSTWYLLRFSFQRTTIWYRLAPRKGPADMCYARVPLRGAPCYVDSQISA